MINNNIFDFLLSLLTTINNIGVISNIPIIIMNLCYRIYILFLFLENENNKFLLYINGGIQILLQLLSCDSEEIQTNILSALINMLSCIIYICYVINSERNN